MRRTTLAGLAAGLSLQLVLGAPGAVAQAPGQGAGAAPPAPITWRDLLARERPSTGIRIAYGSEPDQFAELWLPAGPGPHPVVVMVHGGCWQAALPGVELMAYISEDLRRHGIAVWNVEYRRLGTLGAGYPGTFRDIAQATDHLRLVAADHDLDLGRVISAGHSAGGHLALWAGARGRIGADSPLHDPEPLPLRGVVALAGIVDLASYRETGPEACGGPVTIDRLVGAKARRGVDPYVDTSPAAMAPIGLRQAILSGELDRIVPPDFGVAYAARAAGLGDPVREVTYTAAGHFELIDPTSAAWAEIRAIITEMLGP